MQDYLAIGSTPCDEDCAQVGSQGYYEKSQLECREFIAQLRRQFGNEPEHTQLRTVANPHDFGTYYEVHCFYDDDYRESVAYALTCADDAWSSWDKEAKASLKIVSPD